METTVLGFLILRPLLWRTMALDREMDTAKIFEFITQTKGIMA